MNENTFGDLPKRTVKVVDLGPESDQGSDTTGAICTCDSLPGLYCSVHSHKDPFEHLLGKIEDVHKRMFLQSQELYCNPSIANALLMFADEIREIIGEDASEDYPRFLAAFERVTGRPYIPPTARLAEVISASTQKKGKPSV